MTCTREAAVDLPRFVLVAAYIGGRRLSRSGNWMLADPEAAATIVWDAGIDAAAATALRSGRDGLTPDVLRALSAVWTGAGLDANELTPPPKPAPAPGMNPFVLMASHKVYAGTVVETDKGEMFRFKCKCGQSWDSPVDSDNELAGPAAHIKDVMEEAAGIAQSILDRAAKRGYPLTHENNDPRREAARQDDGKSGPQLHAEPGGCPVQGSAVPQPQIRRRHPRQLGGLVLAGLGVVSIDEVTVRACATARRTQTGCSGPQTKKGAPCRANCAGCSLGRAAGQEGAGAASARAVRQLTR
jgi:hypothetical protein